MDASENPGQVTAILEGELFDFTCRNCEQEITLEHSIRFEDHSARAMCQHDPPRQALLELPSETPADYRLRRLSDQNAFIELIRIWKESLDDGVMLLVKHMLARDVEEEAGVRPLVCSFENQSEVEGEPYLDYVVWLPEEEDPRLFSMPMQTYNRFRSILSNELDRLLPAGQWVDWDSATAQRLYVAAESATMS